MIKVDDFVILTEKVKDLEKNSVGLVKKVTPTDAMVFFIGKDKEVSVDLSKIEFLDVTKTGKPKRKGEPYPYKICNVCYVLKDNSNFVNNQTDKSGRNTTRPTCRECRKTIEGVALKPSEKKRMDAIKPEKFFICPICKKASIPDVTASLVKDHNHETGKAREWICDSCNTGLGRFKDDIELMKEAIKYLEKYAED